MKLITRHLASVWLLAAACGALAQDAGSTHLRVLATHDFHGALEARSSARSRGKELGGAAALEDTLRKAAQDCQCTTLRVDGGDQMQGTLLSNLRHGEAVVKLFNALSLDAAAIGNHELDWGVDVFEQRLREARYAWLAANVYQRSDGKRAAWAKPYTVLERDGLRIGIIGYATVETPGTLRPQTTAPYQFRGGYAGIKDALASVWQQQPDFVALVAHAGGACTPKACSGELVELAEQLPPGSVHLIVGGHEHTSGQGVVNGIPIIRAGANGQALAVIDLYRQPDGSRRFKMETTPVVAEKSAANSSLATLLAPYLAEAETLGKTPVVTLRQTLSASEQGNRTLGNLIAEAQRLSAGADIGLHNPGGVRADLLKGAVRYNDVYRVLPFGNVVTKVAITGAALKALAGRTSRYYWANLQLVGNKGKTSVRLGDGSEIDDGKVYSVAMPDFLAQGGDGLKQLIGLPQTDEGITVLDAFVTYLSTHTVP